MLRSFTQLQEEEKKKALDTLITNEKEQDYVFDEDIIQREMAENLKAFAEQKGLLLGYNQVTWKVEGGKGWLTSLKTDTLAKDQLQEWLGETLAGIMKDWREDGLVSIEEDIFYSLQTPYLLDTGIYLESGGKELFHFIQQYDHLHPKLKHFHSYRLIGVAGTATQMEEMAEKIEEDASHIVQLVSEEIQDRITPFLQNVAEEVQKQLDTLMAYYYSEQYVRELLEDEASMLHERYLFDEKGEFAVNTKKRS